MANFDSYWYVYLLEMQQQKIQMLSDALTRMSQEYISLYKHVLCLEEQTKITHNKSFFERLFLDLPVNVFLFDTNNIALYCNKSQAENMGIEDINFFKNKHLREIANMFQWSNEAYNELLQNNRRVLETKTPDSFEETISLDGESRTFKSFKKPFSFSGEDNLILGMAVDISEQTNLSNKLKAEEKALTLAKKIGESTEYLSKICDQIELFSPVIIDDNGDVLKISKKQALCLLHLLKGYSAKQIAQAMNISPRTVEEHINHLKDKLGCRTKSELLMRSFTGRFLHSFLTSETELLS